LTPLACGALSGPVETDVTIRLRGRVPVEHVLRLRVDHDDEQHGELDGTDVERLERLLLEAPGGWAGIRFDVEFDEVALKNCHTDSGPRATPIAFRFCFGVLPRGAPDP
jgi:hypothetical protein